MADFWNRHELANPPPHIEKKRREAVCEWIPCSGSKRKLDLTAEEKRLEEATKPSAKLFAVDETVQDYVLDSNGYMRGLNPVCPTTNENVQTMDAAQQPPKGDAEIESMAVDESEELTETGLRECMVENDKHGGGNGNTHGIMGNSLLIDNDSVQYTSLILSNEVRNSMAKRPVDISTVLAQEMVKQATMAVVLWKPLLPSPRTLDTVLSSSNSQNQTLPSSNAGPTTNFVHKELRFRHSNEEEMETTEEI